LPLVEFELTPEVVLVVEVELTPVVVLFVGMVMFIELELLLPREAFWAATNSGLIKWRPIEMAPADSPINVTFSGSPPKL